ncbi:MAG: hypothetical protein HZA53_12870 [Planctomycetes bacterium]|nr:hypothetical protein [Planctomycetota bacterium]
MRPRAPFARLAEGFAVVVALATLARSQTRFFELLAGSDRVVEARIERAHELGSVFDRVLELAVTRALIAPEDEPRLFVRLRGDEWRRADLRPGPTVLLWLLAIDPWRDWDFPPPVPKLDALLAGSAPYVLRDGPFPLIETRGLPCIEFDARAVELPEDLPLSKRRTAANASARLALRSEVHACIERWSALRGAAYSLALDEGWRAREGLSIRSDGRGTATDRDGREYDLHLAPEDMAALHAVVEREHAHALPARIGRMDPEQRRVLHLRIRDEHGTTMVRVHAGSGDALAPEEREAIERFRRVERALLEQVERWSAPVVPPRQHGSDSARS